MDRKYLKSNFDENAARIERLVKDKTATLRMDIEMSANKVFMLFDEFQLREQEYQLANEQTDDADKRFSFLYWFLMLIVPVIYFIDLLLSQDAISYLLPSSIGESGKVFFSYLVPALFVIADVGIGLVRHKIKSEYQSDESETHPPLFWVNITGILFCLILPTLVGATILAFVETTEIQASEVTARVALMVLSLTLHAFVIFLFPKRAFDYCFNYSAINKTKKSVNRSEKVLFKMINELTINSLHYKQKADTYSFVPAIEKIEFAFRSRLLINQILKTEAWVAMIKDNKQLQNVVNEDPLLGRYFPYKEQPIVLEEKPKTEETKVVELPVVPQHKGIHVSYFQNDSSGYAYNSSDYFAAGK